MRGRVDAAKCPTQSSSARSRKNTCSGPKPRERAAFRNGALLLSASPRSPIARDEYSREQVERLLRAGRHDDVICVARDGSSQRYVPRDRLAQALPAFGLRVPARCA